MNNGIPILRFPVACELFLLLFSNNYIIISTRWTSSLVLRVLCSNPWKMVPLWSNRYPPPQWRRTAFFSAWWEGRDAYVGCVTLAEPMWRSDAEELEWKKKPWMAALISLWSEQQPWCLSVQCHPKVSHQPGPPSACDQQRAGPAGHHSEEGFRFTGHVIGIRHRCGSPSALRWCSTPSEENSVRKS